MIASFSAEPPVIRGRNRSHASSCLFVRDQETSALHTFDRAGGVAGTRRETKSQLARCSYLNENASIHGEPFRNPSILSLPGVMALWSRFLLGTAACHQLSIHYTACQGWAGARHRVLC